MKLLSESFELMVFTASSSQYANAILNYLDPNYEIFQHRLYREHCVLTEQGYYVKDLRIIGNRFLQDIVLVDNCSCSFGFQPDNGIPILPFYDNQNDDELSLLVDFLYDLEDEPDVRNKVRDYFKIKNFSNLVYNPISFIKENYGSEL